MARALAATFVALIAVLLVALVRYSPPTAHDAPPAEFSGLRAREVQKAIAGETRMTGSEGNARARTFLRGELERAGFMVSEVPTFSCGRWGTCSDVVDVVARRAGSDPKAPAILLVAHLDSVPVSPGANDDGLGTATLVEAGRALAAGAPLAKPLVILLSDGEEDGLLGAEAFARDPGQTRGIAAVINVDARGNRGPSAMFETTSDNAWLIGLVSTIPRPVTTSMFYEVYKRMPNDTDFSAMRSFAVGVNFANVAGIEHYHTPIDDLASSDTGTLQHHGDHVVAMVRAFDREDLSVKHHGDAVWFDVMATFLVRWPAEASLPLALVAFALVFARLVRARTFDRGLAAFGAGLLAAIAIVFAATLLLKAGGALPAPFVAHPSAPLVALYSVGIAAALACHKRLGGTPAAAWAGTWLVYASLAVIAAWLAPGTSYLFVVPALVSGALGWSPMRQALAATVAFVLAVPIAVALPAALGFAVPVLPAFFGALLSGMFAPFASAIDRRVAPGLAAIGTVGIATALIVPAFSVDVPQRVNVLVRQDETTTRVHVDTSWGLQPWGQPPKAMTALLAAPRPCEPVSFFGLETTCADAPRLSLEPPTIDDRRVSVDDSGRRTLSGFLRSPRGAPRIAIELPRERSFQVKVEGLSVTPRSGYVDLRGLAPGSFRRVEITGAFASPFTIVVHDRSFGVPSGTIGEKAVAARPKEAVPFQEGDLTIVSRTITAD